ncbi:MAG: hypothetical protein RBR02_06345 [Desulfuromonadaceae bacterium]|nr:hypothetical protein [Desulfuromonadaceae bacterium]
MQKRIIQILIVLNLITISLTSLFIYQATRFDEVSYTGTDIINTINYFHTDFTIMPPKYQQIQVIRELYGKNPIIINKYFKDAYGKAIPILNLVILSPDIPVNIFSKVFAHELEHLRFEFKEYLVEYRAIIRLWESGIPHLKYQAYLGAKTVLDGRLGKRYDCTDLLVEYMKENI